MTQNKNGIIMHSYPQVSRVIGSLDIHCLTFSRGEEHATAKYLKQANS